MFAFAGAPNFPTIQSDMKDRRQFFTAVLFAMASKDINLSSYSKLNADYNQKSASS
jgi:hypothetical protein